MHLPELSENTLRWYTAIGITIGVICNFFTLWQLWPVVMTVRRRAIEELKNLTSK